MMSAEYEKLIGLAMRSVAYERGHMLRIIDEHGVTTGCNVHVAATTGCNVHVAATAGCNVHVANR